LQAWPRVGRDVVCVQHEPPQLHIDKPMPQADLRQLLLALHEVLQRAELFNEHHIAREPLSVRATMSAILQRLRPGRPIAFAALCTRDEGRMGVVVCFLALLELARAALIRLHQDAPDAPLAIALAAGADTSSAELAHG